MINRFTSYEQPFTANFSQKTDKILMKEIYEKSRKNSLSQT